MARIDRLEEAPRRPSSSPPSSAGSSRAACWIGSPTSAERTGEFLRELKAIELIYEKSAFPELAYMFKHALTHDVAYHSLLVQRRKELHRLIGLAIEELYADRLAEHYEVLAYHFARGEEWAKALHYLREAGTKAAARSAFPEAVSHLEGALRRPRAPAGEPRSSRAGRRSPVCPSQRPRSPRRLRSAPRGAARGRGTGGRAR